MNIRLGQKCNLLKLLFIFGFTITLALSFSSGPPPGYTGGFREPICTSCHGGHEADDGVGSLDIVGVPTTYTPGECYDLSVVLQRPGQKRWGFQLAARFYTDDTTLKGNQAGDLISIDGDPTTTVQTVPVVGTQYINHTADGTFWGVDDGPVQWDFTWCAPDEAPVLVSFDAAGNAANGDGGSGGDYIYTGFAFSRPPAK